MVEQGRALGDERATILDRHVDKRCSSRCADRSGGLDSEAVKSFRFFVGTLGLLFLSMGRPPAPRATSTPPPYQFNPHGSPTVEIVRPTPTPSFPPIPPRPIIALPSPPPMSEAAKQFLLSTGGRTLILDFETGGRSGYDPHPEWPGGASGVTVGIGYDCGYYRKSVIDLDWKALETAPRTRLVGVQGLTGTRARDARQKVIDIYIVWAIAIGVFDNVDVAREYANAKHAIAGFEDLRPNAQAAWLSLGFNRGWSFDGANRIEMRAARDLAPKQDYSGMATQFRKMVRVWRGMSIERGMTRRRYAEATLLETP